MFVRFSNGRVASLPFGSEDVMGESIEEVHYSQEEVEEYRKEWHKDTFMIPSPEDYISVHLKTREEKERLRDLAEAEHERHMATLDQSDDDDFDPYPDERYG